MEMYILVQCIYILVQWTCIYIVQIPMSVEQHGSGLQDNAILQEEETSDDITDIITCVSEKENGNTESQPSTTEKCALVEDDTGMFN